MEIIIDSSPNGNDETRGRIWGAEKVTEILLKPVDGDGNAESEAIYDDDKYHEIVKLLVEEYSTFTYEDNKLAGLESALYLAVDQEGLDEHVTVTSKLISFKSAGERSSVHADELTQRQISVKDGLVKAGGQSTRISKLDEEPQSGDQELKNSNTYMLAATVLILTMTFAAGFSIRDILDTTQGNEEGVAVLAKKAAFIAFVVSDSFALLLSIAVAVAQFAAKGIRRSIWAMKLDLLYNTEIYITLAMASLVMAFLSGLYCVPLGSIRIYLLVVGSWICIPMPLYISFCLVKEGRRGEGPEEVDMLNSVV